MQLQYDAFIYFYQRCSNNMYMQFSMMTNAIGLNHHTYM